MTAGGYDAFADPYCYEGTFVLKNKAGRRTEAELEAFELEMYDERVGEPLPEGDFGPAHYQAVHHHLFQDVYDWAGQYRTVRTAKGGNPFCYPEYIEAEMTRLFARLSGDSFRPETDLAVFATAAAEFLGELNAIHPFREGNGRAQLSFLHLLARRAGHRLDFNRIKPATFMRAMITSFHGDTALLAAEIAALGR